MPWISVSMPVRHGPSIPVLPKPARLRPRLALQQHQFLPLGEPRGTRVGQSCKVCRRVSQSPSDMTTWQHTRAFLGAGGPPVCLGCRVRGPGHDAWNLGGGAGTDTLWRNRQRSPRHAIRGDRWRRHRPTRPVAVPGLERQASNGPRPGCGSRATEPPVRKPQRRVPPRDCCRRCMEAVQPCGSHACSTDCARPPNTLEGRL